MPIIRNAMRLCALLLIGGTLVAAPVAAQSLADVARKEAERREHVKESGKTYTNQDLKAVPAPPADTATASSDQPADSKAGASSKGDVSAPAKSGDKTAADDKAAKADGSKEEVKDQAYWSKRITDLREQLNRDLVYVDALQSRINGLTTDFVNRDDPVQRSQIASDRQHAIDELARLKKGTEDDRKAIADLEEEARRAGVPPGWLR
jgi:hypothetical protein